MKKIEDIIRDAERLKQETMTGAITPERLGNILCETLENLKLAVTQIPVPSFDLITSRTHRVGYCFGEKAIVDFYPVLRFRHNAPELSDRYRIEIYRYVNKGKKRYQKRLSIPLYELSEYQESKGDYGALVLNVSLMRIFWEMWDAQGVHMENYKFHNGGTLQYNANDVAESWLDIEFPTESVVKFNGLSSGIFEGQNTGNRLISGRFGIRLYDTEQNVGSDMAKVTILLKKLAATKIEGKEFVHGYSFSLKLK